MCGILSTGLSLGLGFLSTSNAKESCLSSDKTDSSYTIKPNKRSIETAAINNQFYLSEINQEVDLSQLNVVTIGLSMEHPIEEGFMIDAPIWGHIQSFANELFESSNEDIPYSLFMLYEGFEMGELLSRDLFQVNRLDSDIHAYGSDNLNLLDRQNDVLSQSSIFSTQYKLKASLIVDSESFEEARAIGCNIVTSEEQRNYLFKERDKDIFNMISRLPIGPSEKVIVVAPRGQAHFELGELGNSFDYILKSNLLSSANLKKSIDQTKTFKKTFTCDQLFKRTYKQFKSIPKESNSYGNAQFNLGLLSEKSNKFGNAKQHYKKVPNVSAEYPKAQFKLGLIAIEQRKTISAKLYFNRVPKGSEFYLRGQNELESLSS
ncbi:hypothetical protein HOG98_05750 [bacterium]|jgi:hypothetical protein|nr:hypothetical protein [bacterium]